MLVPIVLLLMVTTTLVRVLILPLEGVCKTLVPLTESGTLWIHIIILSIGKTCLINEQELALGGFLMDMVVRYYPE